MPKFNSYIKGFNLFQGEKMGGYNLNSIKGSHIEVVRYRKYKYPITLSFANVSGNGNPKLLLKSLKNKVKNPEIIYTHWGNPYECHFGSPKISSTTKTATIITSTGFCSRILKQK